MYVRFDTNGITIHTTYNAFMGRSAVDKADNATWLRVTREAAKVEERMALLLDKNEAAKRGASEVGMAITYEADAERVSLPKWPALVVVGDDIEPGEAAEVIIRTDPNCPDFEYAGNDKGHRNRMSALFGIEPARDHHGWTDDHDRVRYYRERHAAMDKLRNEMGILPLNYMHNHQIISAYVGGPHGWCDWNGRIGCNGYNIGKWPDVEDVARDLEMITKAFSFLDLRVQLFSGEHCEDTLEPRVHFIAHGGDVTVRPSNGVVLEVPDETITFRAFTPGGEIGISLAGFREKVIQVYGHVPELTPVED